MRAAAARGADNFRFFADKAPEAGNGLSLHQDEHLKLYETDTHRSGGRHHAVEHAVHAVHLEDRAGPGRRLHGGCTSRRNSAPLSAMILAEISREAGVPDGVWNTVNGFGESCREKRIDRTSGDQGHRLRGGDGDRHPYHAPVVRPP